MCGTISLPASIVSVSSGTSGHAPVQAFQRLHRGYFFRLFYCLRSSPRGSGVSVAHAHHPLPHRGPMTKLPTQNRNSAPPNGQNRSRKIRYYAVSADRAPRTNRCRRAGFRPGRRSDILLAAVCGWRLDTGGGDNSHSLFRPRN